MMKTNSKQSRIKHEQSKQHETWYIFPSFVSSLSIRNSMIQFVNNSEADKKCALDCSLEFRFVQL